MWYNNQSGVNLDGKYINKHVMKKIMATQCFAFQMECKHKPSTTLLGQNFPMEPISLWKKR